MALLREWRPRVVVSVGGYASMPAVFAARRLGIPVVVVSYDRTPGRASRLSARSAAACAVAFENSPLPRAEITGAPVRLARYLAGHRDDERLAVRQITGERFVDGVAHVDGAVVHQVVAYESDMAAVYEACDVIIGRGGASTVHEVAVTGTPAILVPWAASADDHQTENVRWLSEVGGAIMLRESELDRLAETLDALRADPLRRDALAAAALRRGEVHRSGALAGLIERVAIASSPS